MKRLEVMDKIIKQKLVAVIRGDSKEEAMKSADAVIAGGIKIIEVTMTIPLAMDVVKELSYKYRNHNDVLIGAGTVLDVETARICILSGAEFIVSPSLDIDVVKICNKYSTPIMPGVMTVADAVKAMEYGCDILKVFPANNLGSSIIKNMKGPLPNAEFMPTGGVGLDNVEEWIKSGAVAVGLGGSLTKGAKTGDYNLVKETAQKLVEKVCNMS